MSNVRCSILYSNMLTCGCVPPRTVVTLLSQWLALTVTLRAVLPPHL